MLIHGYNHHYRETQKNLFLGETLCVFATTPDGQARQEGQQAEGQQSHEGHENEEESFYKKLKGWVPEEKEYADGDHLDTMDEWLTQLGSVSLIQTQIDGLLKLQTQLKSPKYIQNLPNVNAKYQEAYAQLVQIRKLKEMNRDMSVNWGELEKNAKGERDLKAKMIHEDIDNLIKKLVTHRQIALRVLKETMKSNFKKRLEHFKKQWEHPPHGYEDSGKNWIDAADQILKEVDKLDLSDSKNPKFPEGHRVFKKAEAMWQGIRDMERTLEIYRAGQEHGLTPEGLKKRLDDLEQKKKHKITPELQAKNAEKISELMGRLDGALGAYKARYASLKPELEAAHKTGEIKQYEDAIKEVEKFRVQLESNRNLNEVIDNIINNSEPDSEGKLIEAETYTLKKGLRGQLDFITKVPVSETQRNHMMFNFNEALNALEKEIESVDQNIDMVYPDMLKKINLIEDELKAPQGGKKYKIYWLAAQPTWGIVSHAVQDVFKKNYERDTQRKAGIWGSKAFKFLEKLPTPILQEQLRPLKEIAGKMAIEQEHAETNDYQEWMKNHEHASVPHLFHVMHETTNQFEFRAVIELLCKKGRMRFDDEGFLKQLNRWQKSYPVPGNKLWHLQFRTKSEDLLRDAVHLLYDDIDIFQGWRSSNSSAIESEKGKHSNRFAEVSEVPGGLESEIKPILAEYEADLANPHVHFSNADPVKYEAVLLYAIQQGKMDAEDVLYYVIKGIGKGLLPLERGSAFTNLNNNYPAIEIFASPSPSGGGQKPTLEDVQAWAAMDKEQYLDWFHSYVMYLPKVQQRLIKAQSQGIRLDHDYFTAFAGYLNSSTVKRLLQSNTEGYGLQETAIQNGTVGMLFALDTLAESYDDFKDNTGQRALSTMVENIMTFDGITSGRTYAKQTNFYRMSNSTRNTKPRYAGAYGKVYGRGEMTTGEHLDAMKKHLHLLDFDPRFPMIQKLINNEFRDDAEARRFAEALMKEHKGIFGQSQAPTGIDNLYENIGTYIDYAIKQQKPSIKTFLSTIRAEHHENLVKMKAAAKSAGGDPDGVKDIHRLRHDRDHAMQHEREHFAEKMSKGELEEKHEHGEHGGGGGKTDKDSHHEEHPAEGGDHSHGPTGGHGGDDGSTPPSSSGHTPVGGGPSSSGHT